MLLTAALLALAAPPPPDSIAPRKHLALLPVPIVFYTPETRFGYGAAATATIRFRRDDDYPAARPSQLTFGVAYTQNKQLLLYLPFRVFYQRNKYYTYGEIGYYRYSYLFFGLKENAVPAELYSVNYPRVRLNAFRCLGPGTGRGQLYVGLRYQYEDYQVTEVEPGGNLADGTVPGGRGSRLNGAGVGVFYDSRDNILFPTKGVAADFTLLPRNQAVGAGLRGQTTYFDRYEADVSSYHALGSHVVLAFNYFASFTVGTAPFNALSQLGGGRRMRGYYAGRFRDQNAALLQSELRFDVYRRLGAVVFGAVGTLGDAQTLLRLAEPKAAYGAGLRFTFNRRDHLNVRADYALGRQSSGFYLTVGEAF